MALHNFLSFNPLNNLTVYRTAFSLSCPVFIQCIVIQRNTSGRRELRLTDILHMATHEIITEFASVCCCFLTGFCPSHSISVAEEGHEIRCVIRFLVVEVHFKNIQDIDTFVYYCNAFTSKGSFSILDIKWNYYVTPGKN